jgi:hypothetical protein
MTVEERARILAIWERTKVIAEVARVTRRSNNTVKAVLTEAGVKLPGRAPMDAAKREEIVRAYQRSQDVGFTARMCSVGDATVRSVLKAAGVATLTKRQASQRMRDMNDRALRLRTATRATQEGRGGDA